MYHWHQVQWQGVLPKLLIVLLIILSIQGLKIFSITFSLILIACHSLVYVLVNNIMAIG